MAAIVRRAIRRELEREGVLKEARQWTTRSKNH
jgi:hypothetical protein